MRLTERPSRSRSTRLKKAGWPLPSPLGWAMPWSLRRSPSTTREPWSDQRRSEADTEAATRGDWNCEPLSVCVRSRPTGSARKLIGRRRLGRRDELAQTVSARSTLSFVFG